jgi:glycosyltransferase involved in cell wall biosynthesis
MRIAICIPTYNREKTIVSTINSVINQAGNNIEIIVFDNKSTDNTVNLVTNLFGDRIRLHVNETNIGYVGNINRCLSLFEEFDWISIIHSDDYHIEDSFKFIKPYLSKYKDAGIVFSNLHVIDENDRIIQLKSDDRKELVYTHGYNALLSFHERPVPCSGTIYNSKAIREVGFYSEQFPYSADEEYGCRVSSKFDLVQIPKVIGYYRLHSDNLQIQTWLKDDFFNNFFKMKEVMLSYSGMDNKLLISILEKSKAVLSHSISVRLAKEGFWSEALKYNYRSFLSNKFYYFKVKNLIKSAYVILSPVLPRRLNLFLTRYISKTR